MMIHICGTTAGTGRQFSVIFIKNADACSSVLISNNAGVCVTPAFSKWFILYVSFSRCEVVFSLDRLPLKEFICTPLQTVTYSYILIFLHGQ